MLSGAAGLYTRPRPDARATLTDFALLPPALRAPFPVTNEAALGYAFDRTTSPAALALIQVRAGRVATTGDPRPWQDGEVTPIQNLARLFGRSPVDAAEWYFPVRLSLDVDGRRLVRPQRRHAAARACACPTAARSGCRSTRSRPTSRAAGCCAARAG